MPLVWSNERPNAEDYTSAFHRISLSSSKVGEKNSSRYLLLLIRVLTILEFVLDTTPPSNTPLQIIDFIMQRQPALKSLVMSNSEGFWGDEGDYLNLTGKHNFQASHLGEQVLGRISCCAPRQLFSCLPIYRCSA